MGKALLFFGFRHPDVDFLYEDELKQWEALGAVQIRTAASRKPDGEIKYAAFTYLFAFPDYH